MTRVSVIIPSFNYARYLPEALDSIRAQTHDEWECIVVDDGSTDDTEAVAQRYVARDARIAYVKQPNRGPSAARNNGIRRSSGEYLQFLDSDDKLAPHKLALHARFLDEHPDVDVVYSLATFFRSAEPDQVLYSLHGRLTRPLMQRVSGNRAALEKLQEFNISPPSALLTRRRAFERAGTFNEAARGTEDWDLWLRFAIAGCAFEYLEANGSVAFVRTHDESLSRSGERMMRSLIASAATFGDMPAGAQWREPILPAVYEMAAGVDAVERGSRLGGAKRIWRASRAARSSLTAIRWVAYAAAACVLPRPLFRRFVQRPIPELALELVRRLSRKRG